MSEDDCEMSQKISTLKYIFLVNRKQYYRNRAALFFYRCLYVRKLEPVVFLRVRREKTIPNFFRGKIKISEIALLKRHRDLF